MRAFVGVTGATGFVGAAIVEALIADGFGVRVLVRDRRRLDLDRTLVESGLVEIAEGRLECDAALSAFVANTDHIVHCAGLTHARNREAFVEVNVTGAAHLANAFAARSLRAPGADETVQRGRFIHISSLAARYPAISSYAQSKFDSESAVAQAIEAHTKSRSEWIVLRAPAMYGPRDSATLPFFKSVKTGLAPVPGGAVTRASILYVMDFAQAVLAALKQAEPGRVYEVGDDKPEGHSWHEIAKACAMAQSKSVKILALPKPVLSGWAYLSSAVVRLKGDAPMVTPEKINEFFHPDWTARDNLLTQATQWRPQTPLLKGFQLTSAWYRARGLL